MIGRVGKAWVGPGAEGYGVRSARCFAGRNRDPPPPNNHSRDRGYSHALSAATLLGRSVLSGGGGAGGDGVAGPRADTGPVLARHGVALEDPPPGAGRRGAGGGPRVRRPA